jgi:hypothetical protein
MIGRRLKNSSWPLVAIVGVLGALSAGCLAEQGEEESQELTGSLLNLDSLKAGDRIVATFQLLKTSEKEPDSRGGGIHIWTDGMDSQDPLTLIVLDASKADWDLYSFKHELHALSDPLSELQAQELNNTTSSTGLLADFVSDEHLLLDPNGLGELHIASLKPTDKERMEFTPMMVLPVRVTAQ